MARPRRAIREPSRWVRPVVLLAGLGLLVGSAAGTAAGLAPPPGRDRLSAVPAPTIPRPTVTHADRSGTREPLAPPPELVAAPQRLSKLQAPTRSAPPTPRRTPTPKATTRAATPTPTRAARSATRTPTPTPSRPRENPPVSAAGTASCTPLPGVTARTEAVHQALCRNFPGITSYGGLRPGDSGYHGTGRAIDAMVGTYSTGEAVASWARANAATYGITEVLWAQKIWTTQRASEGWRPMADRGSATANHFDHTHLTVAP